MHKNAVAIFVKTPDLSPVKTRLAKSIGTDNAVALYCLFVKCVHETLSRALNTTPYWAIAEENGLKHPMWDNNFQKIYTGPGGLGARQHHVYSTLRQYHDNVMLIGADCPQITLNVIQGTFEALNNHEFAVGPASDGGYYLFAGRRDIQKTIWTRVQYSQTSTRTDLCDQLPTRPHMLPPLTDADEEHDLPRIMEQMPSRPSGSQQNLIEHIAKIISFDGSYSRSS